jgi:hypothetical protein
MYDYIQTVHGYRVRAPQAYAMPVAKMASQVLLMDSSGADISGYNMQMKTEEMASKQMKTEEMPPKQMKTEEMPLKQKKKK